MIDENYITLKETQSNRLAILDVAKYILSFMVVAIHAQLFPMVLYPWLRIAVPLFFIISSYLFWGKVNKIELSTDKNKQMKKYVIRNLKLYLFYFVVLTPYTLLIRDWFDNGILSGFVKMFQSALFASTFPVSWYIQASIIGMVIIFFASKKVNNIVLLIVSVFIYLFAAMRSSYNNIIENIPCLQWIYSTYEFVFLSPMGNVSAALVWIVLGKIFAERNINIKFRYSFFGLLVFGFLLYAEWRFVYHMNGTYNNDCYVLLMSFVFFIFEIIRKIKLSVNSITTFLGKSSVIIYTTHSPVIYIINYLCYHIKGYTIPLFTFVVTVAVCTIMGYCIFKLEKSRVFKWLKFSH